MLTDGTAPAAPMGSLTYRYLIEPAALACVSRDTLVQFLRPHEAWCAEHGLVLDELAPDASTLERIHHVLSDPEITRPDDLGMALYDLGATAGRWGTAEEVQRAIDARAEGVQDPNNVVEGAFVQYLRGLSFASIADQTHGRQVQRRVEFVPSSPRAPQGHQDSDLRKRLELDAGRFFGSRNRTRFCECRVVESTTEIQFEIVRGNIPRRHRTVIEEARVDAIDFVPARSDFVIFDKRTRMLSVHAQQAAEHDYYRRLIGRLYFGSEDHFRVEEVFSGDPLATRGEDALSTVGFGDIQRAVLREVRVLAAGDEINVKGLDVAHRLPMLFFSEGSALQGKDIQLVKLAIYVRLRRRPILVTIKPPNWCVFDRRVGEDLVRSFLIARGFLRLPSIDPPTEQLEINLAA